MNYRLMSVFTQIFSCVCMDMECFLNCITEKSGIFQS